MSAYEELVERCAKRYCISLAEDDYSDAAKVIDAAWVRDKDDPAREAFCAIARSVLAEVYRTLENVTPEMEEAWLAVGDCIDEPDEVLLREQHSAMLRASPLAPPKEGK